MKKTNLKKTKYYSLLDNLLAIIVLTFFCGWIPYGVWKYKLFQKSKKWQFIIVCGLANFAGLFLIWAGMYILGRLDLKELFERNNYNPGTTIAVVAETNLFKFRTQIAEQYLKHLVLGDSINLTFNAYQNLTAKAVVTKISSKGNAENGIMKYLMDAEFEITKNMPVLRSGYSATAEIKLNHRKNVLSIEEKYISYSGDSTYLYILEPLNGTKVKVNVQLAFLMAFIPR